MSSGGFGDLREFLTALRARGDVVEVTAEVVEATVEAFGKVDGLINNAGLMPLSYIEKLKTDEWDRMVDVNIKGVLNGVAAVLPELIKNKGGDIINVSSMAAYRYFPGGGVYCATKAAVKMFSALTMHSSNFLLPTG